MKYSGSLLWDLGVTATIKVRDPDDRVAADPQTIKCAAVFGCFFRLSQNCGKRLLAASCFCVRIFTNRLPLKGSSRNLKFECLSKSVGIIQVLLKSDKNDGQITWRAIYIFDISRSVPLGCEIFLTKVVEDVKKTHFMFNNFFPKIVTLMRSSSSSSLSCSWRVRRVSCSLILKMNLVPPSLPRSFYVPSSFWFIL